MPSFEIGSEDFLLDGRPLQVVSGALHYFRVHPDQWADRIDKARRMGLNTIETYVAWNFHAPEPDVFDLDGPRDLGRFLDLVADAGLHAIVRPGPYICAEWDGGGLPAWLFAQPGVGIRRAEPTYLAAVQDYYGHVLPVVAARQVTVGGPVIAVQVENEYGAYGDDGPEERATYLRALVEMVRGEGIEVPLLTCDQADDEHLERGGLPELHRTATFGSRAAERLQTLRKHQPTGPLMCMEFWDGWFDSTGLQHHVTPPEANAHDLETMLSTGASVNLYMFHGGTNFGLTNGANDKGIYRPISTSYDYDAPLSEHGAPTAKYHALREIIARHLPVAGDPPPDPPAAPRLTIGLDRRVALADLVPVLGTATRHEHPPTHDEVGQWSGFTLYRTQVEADDAVVVVDEVRDRALVSLDGDPVGTLDRATRTFAVPLPRRAGELDLLVEDAGRVNYGPRIGEAKGVVGTVRTATRELTGWSVTPLRFGGMSDGGGEQLRPEVRSALAAAPASDADAPVSGPVLLGATFDSEPGADHFLRLDGWTRGLVWINGFCVGRYTSAGPTATLYVPGPLVRAAGNDVVVLELHGAAAARIEAVAGPDLGPTEP
jgi:beta-galactosidase